jgi:hypothetical protein
LNKLIVKTVVITVIAFVGALAITFGVLSIFKPVVLSDLFASLGGERASAYFMEKEYERTGEFSDLIKLTELLDEDDNYNATAKYCEILLNDNAQKFEDYIEKDGAEKYGSKKEAKEYFYSKYAVAELNSGDITNAIKWAEKCVKVNGYTNSNPYLTFIAKGASLGKTALTQIKENMDKVLRYYFSGQERQDLLADIETIEKIIGEIQ